jgi:hypothetical protein
MKRSKGVSRRAFLLSTALYSLSCTSSVFRFQVDFPEAPGVKKGCEVRYLGIGVGNVERVFLRPSTAGAIPAVVIAIVLKDRNIQIRRDDTFRVSAQGLLGEQFIDIIPGPSSSPPILEGSTVHGETPPSFLSLKRLPIYLEMLELAARLDSLPGEKKDRLVKTFHELLDQATKQQVKPTPKDTGNK